MSKYRIEEVSDDNLWDKFVNESRQGTVFSLSNYLKLAVDNCKRYWILKNNQTKAAITFVLNAEGEICLNDLVIHNGIMFIEDPTHKPTKARSERFEITEFIVHWLTNKYKNVALALSPQVEDLRPFLWHNYGSTDPKDRFHLNLRYTSYLDISSLGSSANEEKTNLFMGLETLRKRNIREARKDEAITEEVSDSSLIIEYYKELLKSQDQESEAEKLVFMKRLIDGLIKSESASAFVSKNGNGENIYATIFCWDKKRAYYLFGAPNPACQNRYKGTIAFWDGFHKVAEKGFTIIDWEGINSPKRGWFKLSFGGEMISYFEVIKNQANGSNDRK